MKTQKWLLVANVMLFLGALSLVAFMVLTPGALAQEPTATPSPEAVTPGPGNGSGFGIGGGRGMMMGGRGMMGGPENSLIAVMAQQLDMTVAELLTELQADTTKTLSQVAYEHNVDLTTIIDAFIALRAERLQQWVDNGQLTQAQADEFLTQMRSMATQHATQPWSEHQRGPGYTDENGDGMCDYRDGQAMGGRGMMGGRFNNQMGGQMGGHFGGPMMGGRFGGQMGGQMMGGHGMMGGWFNNGSNSNTDAGAQ
jgi:hypothetical protein